MEIAMQKRMIQNMKQGEPMSDEIKKPEEITDVPLPEKELSPEEPNKASGGRGPIFSNREE